MVEQGPEEPCAGGSSPFPDKIVSSSIGRVTGFGSVGSGFEPWETRREGPLVYGLGLHPFKVAKQVQVLHGLKRQGDNGARERAECKSMMSDRNKSTRKHPFHLVDPSP